MQCNIVRSIFLRESNRAHAGKTDSMFITGPKEHQCVMGHSSITLQPNLDLVDQSIDNRGGDAKSRIPMNSY